MSQENVEIIRKAYEAMSRDDWFEFLDPEIEWRGPREFPDLAEPHFGHEGVERYLDKVNEPLTTTGWSRRSSSTRGTIKSLSSRVRAGAARGAEPRFRPIRPPTCGRS